MNAPTICDCGHPPTPQAPGACGTGYATDSGTGATRCYACAADAERASMIETGRATLYLIRRQSADGKDYDIFTRHVTNWTGHLSFRCTETRHYARSGGFGCQRTDAWFNGPDGHVWHAINRGDMQIARCRRTKKRWQAKPGQENHS